MNQIVMKMKMALLKSQITHKVLPKSEKLITLGDTTVLKLTIKKILEEGVMHKKMTSSEEEAMLKWMKS